MEYSAKAAFCSAAVLLVVGCGGAGDPAVESRPISSTRTSRTDVQSSSFERDFSWIVPRELAVMPLPGRERPLDQDAAFLDREGIRVLISLTENPPDVEVLASRAIDQTHIPVQDYTPPTLEQMIEFVAVVENSAAAGKPVGVHCTAGLGRSGTMAAAYLVADGASANEAIATLRQLRPGSIETPAQEDAVRRFEEHLGGAR